MQGYSINHPKTEGINSKEFDNKLKEFVKSFVYIYERSLSEYYERLERQVAKPGKWASFVNEVIEVGKSGTEGIKTAEAKAPSMVGINILQKMISSIGNKHNREELKKLIDQLYEFKKDPGKVSEELIKSGIEIFQNFESQFVQVTADKSWQRAMTKLAHDASNRVMSYYKKNTEEKFSAFSITKGILLGESKRYKHTSTGVPHFTEGHTLENGNSKSWNTAELFDKAGLVTIKSNGTANKYYKRKGGKSDTSKYGYRLLFEWELENQEELVRELKEEKLTGREYKYILKLNREKKEELKRSLLGDINNQDPKLVEKRLVENFQEGIEQVKQNAEENFNELESYIDRNFSELSSYIENNQNEVKKVFSELMKQHQEASQQRDKIARDNKDEHKKTQAGVENANQGINNLQKVLVEHGRKLDDLLIKYNDLMKSKLEHINLPTDGKDKISQEVTKLHDAVSAGEKEDVETLLKEKVEVNAKTVDSLITPLHIAAQNGNRKIVDDILNVKNIDINAKTQQGATPLHYAAKNGHKEIVEALLSKGARVDVKTSNDYFTPLHHAAENGYKEIVELLLNKGAKINRTNKQGATALHLTAGNGYKEVVEYLLKRKDIAIDVKTAGDECTPLYHAAQNGFNEVVKTLLNKDDKVINTKNFEGNTPLHVAVYHNHVDVVETLLDKGASVNEVNNLGATPLHYAAQNNFIDVVEALLKVDNINVNVKMKGEGATPLHYAAENGYEKVVEVLLDEGADFSIQTTDQHLTPLHIAARANHRKVIEVLLDKGANIDVQTADQKFTPLHIAARLNNIEVVKVLLDREAKVDLKSARGNTPLCLAVQSGHVDVVKALLDKGADIDAQNGDQGATSLHAAAEGGHKEIVEVLLNKGANVNVQTADQGLTPLHLAAALGEKEVVNVLLGKGANANVGAIKDFTPLHLAAQNGHKDIVNVLLKNGAKIDVKTTQGATPLHYASEKSNWEMAVILLKYGADVNDLGDDQKEKLSNFALNKNYQDVIRLFSESLHPETYLSDVTARNQQRSPHL